MSMEAELLVLGDRGFSCPVGSSCGKLTKRECRQTDHHHLRFAHSLSLRHPEVALGLEKKIRLSFLTSSFP